MWAQACRHVLPATGGQQHTLAAWSLQKVLMHHRINAPASMACCPSLSGIAALRLPHLSHSPQSTVPAAAGKMPALAALAYHRASGRSAAPPSQRLSYAENFLYMLDAGATPNYRPHPQLTRAIDIMFTLHAEHEMNCSTAAARHLASSGVDVYTAIGGAGEWMRLAIWMLCGWQLLSLLNAS